jgi:predicted Zn-dependent protease with MMP-like domain
VRQDLSQWRALAEAEVLHTIGRLPKPLQEKIRDLPVTYEPHPSGEQERHGVEPDTLGLFVGETWAEAGSTTMPLPGQVILFLDNLRAYARNDEASFRAEIRTTYLHELGHYLGLGEDELNTRGLE